MDLQTTPFFGHTSIFPHHEPFAHKMKFLMGVAWQTAMGKEVLVLLPENATKEMC
jgi:hypothetical protein